MQIHAYCSGSIQKGVADTKKLCWSDRERAQVAKGAHPIEVAFLNPDDPIVSLDDHMAVFGRDMFQIQYSDIVIIDGRERRGIGIGVELLAARHFQKPVIGVLPTDSYYRQSSLEYRGGIAKNYVHPHFNALLDGYTDDFEHAGRWIRENLPSMTTPQKMSVLEDAIEAYRTRLLPLDEPMQAIIKR